MAVIRLYEHIGVGASSKLAISAVDANVTLAAGVRYRVVSTIDCFLRVGAAAVTTGASVPLLAKVPEEMSFARNGSTAPVVHCITATGTGDVYFSPLTES